jgi:large subunit ribosomal protein L13
MSTYFPKEGDIARKWFVVDATGLPLGRLASRVARILIGKENPKYTPFIDTGDHVVIINAEKIKITGMKADQKVYHRYTGYPGGLRSEEMKTRMLPKNKLGKQMFTKLKVYRGDKHPHEAQKPEAKVFA